MNTITLKPFALCFAIVGLGQIAFAQSDLKTPDVSQAAEVKQRIALTDITVNYHRPLVNGRKIWGGLFRTAKFGAQALMKTRRLNSAMMFRWRASRSPKELYGLHMIPNADSCTVIFSKTNTGVGKLQLRPEGRRFACRCETQSACRDRKRRLNSSLKI